MSKHHVFSKKSRKVGQTETKEVNFLEHQSWHNLVFDMSPEEALEFIATRFLPKEYEEKIMKLLKEND